MQTDRKAKAVGETVLALKFAGVSLLGFATDALVLKLMLSAGVEPAWGRVASLFCAMQLTFFVNRRHVFRAHEAGGIGGQWLRYMLANSFGNGCNYLIFVTMVSTHWPLVSAPMFALAVGSFCAWMINFTCNRYLVFRVTRIAARALRGEAPLGAAARPAGDDLDPDRLAGDRAR